MDYIKYVDPFYGNFEPDLPTPNETASKWFFLKAQVGNTLPAAVRPFGMVSACSYTGGYPTGYGPFLPNSYSRPKTFLDKNNIKALGFSHFHQSGTGYIGEFYNYSIITPVSGTSHKRFDRFPLSEETASPGFYSCKLANVKCNITVTETAALYNFVFPDKNENSIVFDPILNGIFKDESTPDGTFGTLKNIKITGETITSEVIFSNGIVLFTAINTENAKDIILTDETTVKISTEEKTANIKIGFSMKSMKNALKNLSVVQNNDFDFIKTQGEKIWNDQLSKIKITADEKQKTKFYSNFYRCFIKPVNVTDENSFGVSGDCYVDLATLWDISKTHLPLFFTLQKEKSTALVNSFINSFKRYKRFPNNYLLCGCDISSDKQARALTVNSIYDAYLRGVSGVNWEEALDCMVQEIEREENEEFLMGNPVSEYPSHTIDLAIAAYSTACLAKALKKTEIADKFLSLSENWLVVYDKTTGEVKENGKFYEGCNLNYSYRLLPHIEKRIALYGSDENFEKALDEFFGFNKSAAKQCLNPSDISALKDGEARRGFEGFNNETDMETPYCYAFIGKINKTCEIVRSADKYLYGEKGTGALCGNEDSGALSSLFVVNATGMFPLFGQDKIILGAPSVHSAEISLSNGNTLFITVKNLSDDDFTVKERFFNGKKLSSPFITVNQLMQGGKIEFVY